MSVRPISYNEDTQVYKMAHDELSHEFDMLLTDIKYTSSLDGSREYEFINIPCLVCGANSTHPIGGGAAPPDIQLLFSRLIPVDGCPCRLIPSDEVDEVNLAHAKLHCVQMDGLGRWQVEANAGPSLDLLIEPTNNYVVGLGPFETEPANYAVVNVALALLELVVSHKFVKYVDGRIEVAERPNGTN